MSKKVFISYSHKQQGWVTECLEPCLTAGGAEVLIDTERFRAGRAVVGEMDATQDASDLSVLVLSPDYLASDACRHEMERAVERDPEFREGRTVPVMRLEVPLPDLLSPPHPLGTPLYADLRDDEAEEPWRLLLKACGAELGAPAPAWLSARDETRRFLDRGQSVNLVVTGKAAWRPLIEHLRAHSLPDLAPVDLDQGRTVTLQGLVQTILEACGTPTEVPEGQELVVLDRTLSARGVTRLALLHFDRVLHRYPGKFDLFAALRDLIMTQRKLVGLFHSRRPFAELVPADHYLSDLDLQTVELRGRS